MRFREYVRVLLVALLAAVPLAPRAAAQAPQDLAVPDHRTVLILVRTTISALNDANRTGNYTVFRDLGAPGFRDGNPPARLAEIFANLRKKNLNLAPIVVVEPTLTAPPTINPQGMLHVAGVFPTRPLQVSFEMLYQNVGGAWRLFGIGVDTPAAPPANASAGNGGPEAPNRKPPAVPPRR